MHVLSVQDFTSCIPGNTNTTPLKGESTSGQLVQRAITLKPYYIDTLIYDELYVLC
jgi:hypothetical protein